MKTKKTLAALLALVLVISLTPTVFADDPATSTTAAVVTTDTAGAAASASIDVYSTLNVPTVSVTVNALGNIIANPYKLTYAAGGSENTSQNSLINTASAIINKSDIKIEVTANAMATTGGAVALAGSDTEAENSETTPKIYLQLSMGAITPVDDTVTNVNAALNAFDLSSGTKKVLGEDNTIQLAKKTEASSGYQYAAYGMVGATGGNWTSSDTVNIAVTFTITPVAG